ncbi:MAG: hypothetical protein U1E86_07610 [Burkholderiaceae bacterium]
MARTYSRDDFLALIASEHDKRDEPDEHPKRYARLYGYVVRDDGVYVRRSDDDANRIGISVPLAEHPTGDPNVPALPFPFTLGQFLAFAATAGIVAQMGDDEIEALAKKNEMPAGELAHAARDAECAAGAGGDSPARAAVAYLPDGRPFYTVADAVEITSAALHPRSEGAEGSGKDLAREVARQEHLKVIEEAAAFGGVEVLNPTTMTRHTMPTGDALRRALIARDELQRFARDRLRIELRVRSGAVRDERAAAERRTAGLYTLNEAADAVAKLRDWSPSERDSFLAKLVAAAERGHLRVRDPRDGLPYPKPQAVRAFHDVVTRKDVRECLEREGSPWTWPVDEPPAAMPAEVAKVDADADAPVSPTAGPQGEAASLADDASDAAPEIATDRQGQQVVTHRLDTRRHRLDPLIDLAIERSTDPSDPEAVWNSLCALAREAKPVEPLRGIADGSVQWLNSNDEARFLSKDAFKKRLKRRAAKRR